MHPGKSGDPIEHKRQLLPRVTDDDLGSGIPVEESAGEELEFGKDGPEEVIITKATFVVIVGQCLFES